MTREQLRKFIEQRGLTQAEAARRLDVTDRQMRRWIAGDAPVPLMADYALRYLDAKDKIQPLPGATDGNHNGR